MTNKTLRFEITSWDAESAEFYHPGGFHPTHLGDVLNGQYKIIRKLGRGQNSTVWLAQDTKNMRYVSIKIGSDADGGGEDLARPAISYHQTIMTSENAGKAHVVPLLDHFIHSGPNGKHPCLVFKPLGRSMRGPAEKDFGMMSVIFARELSRQLVLGLDAIHSSGLAHRDIQPGNVMLGLSYDLDESGQDEEEINHDVNLEIPPEDDEEGENEALNAEESEDDERPITISRVKRVDGQLLTEHEPHYLYEPCALADGITAKSSSFTVYLSDLGSATATIISKQDDPRTYPLGLRSPQVILHTHPFRYQAADVWALGLTIWEIVMGNRLLSVDDLGTSELTDDSHLESAINRLGPIPATLCRLWCRAGKWVDTNGKLLHPVVDDKSIFYPYWHGDLSEALRNRMPISLSDCDWTMGDIEVFEDFMRRMLAWEENDRATTKELLEHVWLKGNQGM